jgi:hypothetical protein
MAKSSNVYCFTMNKGISGNRWLINAICLALILTFGASLAAAGAAANSGCGLKCCCTSQPVTRHHAPQEQIRSLMGCCAGSSQMPCDLASATQVELPEVTLASSTGHLPTAGGPAGNISDDLIDRHGPRGHAFDQFVREKFRSPPLYLQNLSFLI